MDPKTAIMSGPQGGRESPLPGRLSSVHLKFYQKVPNIGDRFSRIVAQHYFSSHVVACDEKPLTTDNLILAGSFLHYADVCSHICGAGFISTDPQYLLRVAPQSVHCVRGPLTGYYLQKLGVPHPNVYADPGILAPEIYPQDAWSCGGTVGLVAHYADAGSGWVELCRRKGLKIIDVFSPPERFFAEIHQCEAILSSSLHGIIFAHAYGIPALWIELSDQVIGRGFKFYDYYLSVGLKPEQVHRVQIRENTDPFEIVKLATVVSHTHLRTALHEAIDRTVRQLAHSSEPAGVSRQC